MTIKTAGVTALAIGFTDDGERLVISQPESGRRLVVGDRLVVDPGRVQFGILREWAWEDAGEQRTKAKLEAAAKRRHDERVDRLRARFRRAIELAAPPERIGVWEDTLRTCAAELYSDDELSDVYPYVRREQDELRSALAVYFEWAKRAGVDVEAVETVLREAFDIHHLPDSCAIATRTAAPFEALLDSWGAHVPASATSMLRDLRTNRALRDAFDRLGIELVGAWADETDIGSFFDLDAKRYFVIAEDRDDPIFWAIDVRDRRAGLVEITWLDGNDELLAGPTTLRELLDERLERMEELDAVEDARVLNQLTAWIRE